MAIDKSSKTPNAYSFLWIQRFLPKNERYVWAKQNKTKQNKNKHLEQLLTLDNKTVIIEKHELLTSWKDHLATLLNETSKVDQHAIDITEQKPTKHWMCKWSM